MKGWELFGEGAEDATTKELQQILYFGTYIPIEAKNLSREEIMKVLSTIMLIMEK